MIKKNEKLGQRYIDVAFDWIKHDDKICDTTEIENFLKMYKTVKADNSTNNTSNDDIILSDEQTEVLEICRHQISNLKKLGYNEYDNNSLKRILVQGKAGTGKSTLIN